MNQKLITEIKEKYKNREIEELNNIYKENNHAKYSDEAFEAIKMILQERNVHIPLQKEPTNEDVEKVYSENYLKYKRNAYIGIISGLIIVLVIHSIITSMTKNGTNSIIILYLIYLMGLCLWIWGFYNFVKKKGYPVKYTLLSLLSLLGLVIMVSLKDRGEDRDKTLILICKYCKTEKYITDEDVIEKYFICKTCGEKNVFS